MPVVGGPGIGQGQAVILARLDDSEAAVTTGDFRERWRRFLACMNLYQFGDRLTMWTTSEAQDGTAPDLPVIAPAQLDSAWACVLDQATPSVRPYIPALSAAGMPVPQVEYYPNQLDGDAFAELAWPELPQPVAVLVGDQTTFADQWQDHGWMVIPLRDIQAEGVTWLIETVTNGMIGA
jgi:DEAD/DEAH box helicase domain-containing protein